MIESGKLIENFLLIKWIKKTNKRSWTRRRRSLYVCTFQTCIWTETFFNKKSFGGSFWLHFTLQSDGRSYSKWKETHNTLHDTEIGHHQHTNHDTNTTTHLTALSVYQFLGWKEEVEREGKVSNLTLRPHNMWLSLTSRKERRNGRNFLIGQSSGTLTLTSRSSITWRPSCCEIVIRRTNNTYWIWMCYTWPVTDTSTWRSVWPLSGHMQFTFYCVPKSWLIRRKFEILGDHCGLMPMITEKNCGISEVKVTFPTPFW